MPPSVPLKNPDIPSSSKHLCSVFLLHPQQTTSWSNPGSRRSLWMGFLKAIDVDSHVDTWSKRQQTKGVGVYMLRIQDKIFSIRH